MNISKPFKIAGGVVGAAALAVGLYALATVTAPAASSPADEVSSTLVVPSPVPSVSLVVEPTVETAPVIRDEVTVTPPPVVEQAPAPVVEPEPYVAPAPAPAPQPIPDAVYDPETDSMAHAICEVLADGTQIPCQ